MLDRQLFSKCMGGGAVVLPFKKLSTFSGDKSVAPENLKKVVQTKVVGCWKTNSFILLNFFPGGHGVKLWPKENKVKVEIPSQNE